MKAVKFVFEPAALPDMVVVCLGKVEPGDQLFNTLPTEQDAEPSFTVEKINGNVMTAKAANGRRGTLPFRCLTEAQWNERFG
jgi:hypothetical protein